MRVIDGDTVELSIDLGCRVHTRQIARLYGINAPEVRGASVLDGERTKRRLIELIHGAGDTLFCRTHLDKDDKYGRLLVNLYHNEKSRTSFNDVLVNEGLARCYIP